MICYGRSANKCAVEFATVGRTKAGKIYHHLWHADEIDALLKEHGLAKAVETESDQ
jgi:20S proteasome subunit alpha 3